MQSSAHPTSAVSRRHAALLQAVQLALTLGLGASVLPVAAAPAPATQNAAADIQRLLKDGQATQALKLIDEALARNPADPQMRFRRGVALSMLDRKPEALAVFQKLVEDQPDMPAPHNNMAVIYGAQGEYDKARASLEKAIRTNPAYATAYQNLGDVYAQLASQAYAKALQLDKNDGSVQPKLALLRELTAGTTAMSPAALPGEAPAPVSVAPSPTSPRTMTIAAAPSTAAKASLPAVAPAPAAPASATKAPPAPAVPVAPVRTTPPVVVATASAPVASASAPAKPSLVASAPAAKPPAASAPAKPTVAAAPAASGAASARAADNPVAEVDAAVKAWVAAWSKRDLDAYFAAYVPQYEGQANSRRAWEQERRDRIATRKFIKVEVSELRISVNGDKAEARFKQSYESDALSVNSRKTLHLVRGSSGTWLIRRESAG
jgi:Tfp pilus assembly protein PilF/ketosteroid isomerase-like protein